MAGDFSLRSKCRLFIVALVGMIIRNSVILARRIDREKEAGRCGWEAVERAAVTRFRPIMLTAVAAILGMLPIAPTVFWGTMADAVMGAPRHVSPPAAPPQTP